ncbi:MAG: phosphopantetheine-binding protein [Bacteroidales bacterium]|jgi:acyl carrier protein
METKVLEIINLIRLSKDLHALDKINETDRLRDEIGFTSFDLAELTVRIEDEFDIDIFEDGLVSSIGEIYSKLK